MYGCLCIVINHTDNVRWSCTGERSIWDMVERASACPAHYSTINERLSFIQFEFSARVGITFYWSTVDIRILEFRNDLADWD